MPVCNSSLSHHSSVYIVAFSRVKVTFSTHLIILSCTLDIANDLLQRFYII